MKRAVCVVALVVGSVLLSASPASAKGLEAKITRSAHGTPTIEAESFKELGFGYAYAFAEDNLCTIADAYLTSSAERSRFFGPDAESPEGFTNLDSDLFYQRIKDRGTVEALVAEPPPAGPVRNVKRAVAGYVKGYNKYLEKTGVDSLPDPRCAGAPWVRPITKMDVYRRFYELTLYASGGVAIDGIAGAQPPTATPGPAPAADETVSAAERAQVERLGRRLDLAGSNGSNAWGIGGDATASGGGIVLANPHFPWTGPRRFYQAHLRIPGKINVSGASLYGSPAINIGHTRKLAWSHTVSTAYRFTPIELTLDPNDPTTYVVDGQPRQMEANTVTVQVLQPDGSVAPVSRTLYQSEYGPIFNSLQGQSIFAWTPERAYAMFDVNASNLGRLINHFFRTNRAQSTDELLEILRKYEGIPWVNTIAADSEGEALYADIGSIPNVDDARAIGCAGSIGELVFGAIGLPVLDGSRSECAPATDPDSAAPGIFGSSRLPVLERRDYVSNSNDSYWLTNPAQPLEGFPRIVGDERTQRSLRTRLGLIMIAQRLAGADGFAGNEFTRAQVRKLVFQDRFYAGELLRAQLAAFCHANPMPVGSDGPVDVSEACPVLDAWDQHANLDSRGALLFRRFLVNLDGIPYTTPFDLADPLNTPSGLDASDPAVGTALADAVTDLRGSNIPLDAPYGDYHYELRGSERIPIHGGLDDQGLFNVITSDFQTGVGYDHIDAGSSFVMVTSFEGGCPRDRSILTYSLSENPASEFYSDQTRLFSQKKWVNPPFCAREVREAAESTEVVRAR